MSKYKNRIGEVRYNKHGTKLEIIDYKNSKEIYVQIHDKDNFIIKTSYKAFDTGNIRSAYDKTLCGVGYLGSMKYNVNKIHDMKSYKYWSGMLKRCYSENSLEVRPVYNNCLVNEEWHNFTTFNEWFDNNYYEINNELMDLDKDILHKNNKIYSSESCIFVPHRINSIIISCNSRRGKYPIGVTTNNGKITAKYSRLQPNGKSKSISLGIFDNEIKAFHAYKEAKEKYIKEVADEYKDKIPNKLYKAMYNYKIEITD